MLKLTLDNGDEACFEPAAILAAIPARDPKDNRLILGRCVVVVHGVGHMLVRHTANDIANMKAYGTTVPK